MHDETSYLAALDVVVRLYGGKYADLVSEFGPDGAISSVLTSADAVYSRMNTDPAVQDLTDRVAILEEWMSATDDMIAALNQETDDLATRVQGIIDRISATDTTTAAELQPIVDRLHTIGQDPANPVPAPTTAPTSDPNAPSDPTAPAARRRH